MSETENTNQQNEQNPEDIGARAERIVMDHVGFSMVAGAIPFPLVDIAAVTAIQVDMIKKLAGIYDIDFSVERGKSLAGSIVGATIGNVLGRAGASVLKIVPGVGTLLGIGSQVVFAGAATYALGMVFAGHFADDGNLSNVNMPNMQQQFADFFRKGKDIAKNLRGKQSKQEILDTIEKLKDLKENGSITEEEFQSAKKDLLEKIVE